MGENQSNKPKPPFPGALAKQKCVGYALVDVIEQGILAPIPENYSRYPQITQVAMRLS